MFASLISFCESLQLYIVPALFAVGVIFLFYGMVSYYIMGKPSGDTEVIERGQKNILHAAFIFFIALLFYALVAGMLWILNATTSGTDIFNIHDTEPSTAGGSVQRTPDILVIPDTPPSR